MKSLKQLPLLRHVSIHAIDSLVDVREMSLGRLPPLINTIHEIMTGYIPEENNMIPSRIEFTGLSNALDRKTCYTLEPTDSGWCYKTNDLIPEFNPRPVRCRCSIPRPASIDSDSSSE